MLKEQYEFSEENFNTVGIAHKTKFEGSSMFKKIRYLTSHIIWSYQAVNKIMREFENPLIFLQDLIGCLFFVKKKYTGCI